MKIHPLLVAAVSIAMSVSAQFALKGGIQRLRAHQTFEQSLVWPTFLAAATEPMLLLGFAVYGLGAVLWLAVLAQWDVSKAYPLVGAGFLLTLAVGLVNGEAVTAQRALGVMLISVGVFFCARS